MQRWTYHSLLLRDLSIADSKLNAEGEKGWEMVSACLVDQNTARFYFKKPVSDEDVVEVLHAAPEEYAHQSNY